MKDNGNFNIVWKVTEEEIANTSDNDKCVALITVNKPINEAILNQYKSVKAVLVAFTGYGIHDLDLCKERNISVYNVPDYSSSSVAELAIGLTLAVLREIPKGENVLRNGGWAFSPGGNDLRGKTVGIVGTGTIGICTAKLFNAFGCKLIGWSRSERQEFKDLGELGILVTGLASKFVDYAIDTYINPEGLSLLIQKSDKKSEIPEPNLGTLIGGISIMKFDSLNTFYVNIETNESNISIFPNPTDGHLSIDLGKTYSETNIKICDLLGKELKSTKFYDNKLIEFQFDEPTGIYLFIIENGTHKNVIKFYKL